MGRKQLNRRFNRRTSDIAHEKTLVRQGKEKVKI